MPESSSSRSPFARVRRRSGGLTGLLLVLAFLASLLPVPASARDILDPVTPTSPGYGSSPANLLAPTDAQTLQRLVAEGRSFGIPMSVRIQAVPSAQTQGATQSAADSLYTNQPVESSAGADDGLLLLVQIPSNDKTRSTAAYAVGKNFYPQGGLTPEVLNETITKYMYPTFKSQTIGASVIQGVTWLVYDQLFLTSPRTPKTHGQDGLARAVVFPIMPLMIALGLAYVAWAFVIHRRTRGYRARTPNAAISSPFEAGAIVRGQVDDAVVAAGVIALIDRGSLLAVQRPSGGPGWTVSDTNDPRDPFLQRLWQRLREVAQPETRSIDAAVLGEFRDLGADARRWLEDYLALNGYYTPRARIHSRWFLLAAIVLLVVAAYGLIPTFLSRERAGIFGAGILTILTIATFWWSRRRSYATASGLRAVDDWRRRCSAAASQADITAVPNLEIYALIVDQRRLIDEGRWLKQRFGDHATTAAATVLGLGPT